MRDNGLTAAAYTSLGGIDPLVAETVLTALAEAGIAAYAAEPGEQRPAEAPTSDQPTDEATIRARAADLGKVQGDGAVVFARIRTEVDPILTPAQRDKLQAFHSHAGGHGDHAVQAFEKFLKSAS